MTKLFLKCWNCHDHEIDISDNKIDKFLNKCLNGKFICSTCNARLELVNRDDKDELSFKAYQCCNNHLNIIGLFGKPGIISMYWNEKRNNIDGLLEDIPNIKCMECAEKLVACNNSKIAYPTFPSFKTRMKLGDYWDKQKVPEPKMGEVNENIPDENNPFLPKYIPSEFELRNKERLKKIRKDRNIPLDKSPGKPIE